MLQGLPPTILYLLKQLKMKNNFVIRLFIAIVFIVPALAFIVTNWWGKNYSDLPILGPVRKDKGKAVYHAITDFSFFNQDNKLASTADWKNKIVVADFFFSHCPTVCPIMTKNLQRVQQHFDGNNNILINSFTIDPERDSVGQLKTYSVARGLNNKNWYLLTGSKKEIYRLARKSFMVVATDGDGGPDDFIHSEKFVLIDKQKRIRGYYEGTNSSEVDQLILDIKKLQDENE
jgi:protein SCO1